MADFKINRVKELLYMLSCMGFSIIIGAGLHEHALVWSKMSAAPPASLSMFQGKYGLDPTDFWPIVHPVLAMIILVTLVIYWKSPGRKYIMPSVIAYVIILITTFSYFAPTALSIIQTGGGDNVDAMLQRKAQLWEVLSLIRIIALIPVTLYLYLGLKSSGELVGSTNKD